MMKNIIKGLLCFWALGLISCGPNAARDRQKLLDANNPFKGELQGYVHGVYEIDTWNDTYNRIDGESLENKVYLKDGEYVISFDGETYVLSEVPVPVDLFKDGSLILKWKFGSHYYIEDIPRSY